VYPQPISAFLSSKLFSQRKLQLLLGIKTTPISSRFIFIAKFKENPEKWLSPTINSRDFCSFDLNE